MNGETSAMENKNKSLITYAIVGILLLTFGFYTTTIRYADALTVTLVNVGVTDSRGFEYDTGTNSWYFVSPTGASSIRKIIDNTTTINTYPIETCSDPQNIMVTSDRYAVVLCDNGLSATWTINVYPIPALATNGAVMVDNEGGFTNTEGMFTMLEWKQNKRLYILSQGNTQQNIAHFAMSKVNSTTETMLQGVFNTQATCEQLFGGVIVETSNTMFFVCAQATSTDTMIARFDLPTSSLSGNLDIGGTGGIGDVDYNTITDQLIAVSHNADSLTVIPRASFTVITTFASICAGTAQPMSVEVNENTNQAWVLCRVDADGSETMVLYDVASNTIVSTSAIPSSTSGVQGGGSNHIQQLHWSDARKAMYIGTGWQGNGGGGASATIARISDGTVTTTIGGTVCIDTSPLEDFVSLTCFTDNNGDGIPDSQIGDFATVGQNVTTTGYTFGCQIGLIDCANTDSKTNGIGLLYMLMLLLASLGVVMFVTFRTDHSMNDVHPVVWFILVVAVTGVSWQLKWTDAIPFFGAIVAICALGAFKVKDWFA